MGSAPSQEGAKPAPMSKQITRNSGNGTEDSGSFFLHPSSSKRGKWPFQPHHEAGVSKENSTQNSPPQSRQRDNSEGVMRVENFNADDDDDDAAFGAVGRGPEMMFQKRNTFPTEPKIPTSSAADRGYKEKEDKDRAFDDKPTVKSRKYIPTCAFTNVINLIFYFIFNSYSPKQIFLWDKFLANLQTANHYHI
jgi:hypothetical protein